MSLPTHEGLNPEGTRMHLTTPRLTRLAALSLVAAVIACSPDAATAPATLTVDSPKLAIATSSLVTLQLRAVPPNPIQPAEPYFGYGNLQLRIGALLGDSCVPPNPVSPEPGSTLVSVCGKIFNGGGALYKGGGIYATGGLGDVFDIPIAPFNGAVPPNPCHRYDLTGAVLVSDAVAADMIANTSSYAVRFDGAVGGSTTRIGGRFDGKAWGSVAFPNDPIPPSDPYFAEKVCNVAVTP